ncbi:hypothetical protein SAMN06265795_104152 [Noviherbaspirillum humi]|uniref:dTDP-4-amino-4,6-dideoxygalactose transaminase n=1 Tax=Noviherbaspirillum humi TaxID=1688639 RepID=A0A239FYH2_9BURK|nr:hypothetical protein [Noviherbaspirillum humi]SNS61830.1 hypothetical protein SAMN06265795_104152 [Noviherbaspirillum humi]
MSDAIGGYFSLEVPRFDGFPYPVAHRFQSARAAFAALLDQGRPARVWMPSYLCDAMLEPLAAASVPTSFYSLDADFMPDGSLQPGESDWILYVNYFGLHGESAKAVATRYGSQRLIVDNSQAFFCPPEEVLATLYSPRKFFGVPDGGLLACAAFTPVAPSEDERSPSRSLHLLTRLDGAVEKGYAQFQEAERSFSDVAPKRMSRLTNALLDGIDYDAARRRRNANFRQLDDALAHVNEFSFAASEQNGPLCYPLLSRDEGLRDALIANRIFIPRYWPDVLQRVGPGSREAAWVNAVHPLPCDHRYGESDMARIIEVVRKRISA